MGRVAIFGDMHGNADELDAQLQRLGMDPRTRTLPSDLTVVQVGDLIHRGLQNREILELVDGIMRNQPGQWLQLIGNHEAQYVYEALFEWDAPLERDEADYLHRWFEEGLLVPAAATTTAGGSDALVTHAGLVYDVWKVIIGRPRTAVEAAERINAGVSHEVPWLWQPGEMLYGMPHRMVGPLWAAAGPELYTSWLQAEAQDVPAPFAQVHGHSSMYIWPSKWTDGGVREFGNPHTHAKLRQRLSLETNLRHTKIQLAGSTIIGVDVGHGKRPAESWGPLVFEGTATAPAGATPPTMEWLNETV